MKRIHDMGIGSGGRGAVTPWIFIHGTNVVDIGLIVLFFGLFCYFSVFFPVATSLEIFLPTPLIHEWGKAFIL